LTGLHVTTTSPTGLCTLYVPHPLKKNISPLRSPIMCFTAQGRDCAPRPCFAAPPACLPLHHTSHRPSSPPPRRAPPRPHSRCRLAARGRTHPIAVVASTAGAARLGHRTRPIARDNAAAHRGPHSRLLAAILLLHYDRITRSCCAVLRPPACQVLLKVYDASVCFKCFRCFIGMLQLF
jgi:hypothetical protein